MAEYVYLMEGADAIKVGISDNPERRLGEVAGRLGAGARVVRTVAVKSRDRALQCERGLHKLLDPWALGGECFGAESKPTAHGYFSVIALGEGIHVQTQPPECIEPPDEGERWRWIRWKRSKQPVWVVFDAEQERERTIALDGWAFRYGNSHLPYQPRSGEFLPHVEGLFRGRGKQVSVNPDPRLVRAFMDELAITALQKSLDKMRVRPDDLEMAAAAAGARIAFWDVNTAWDAGAARVRGALYRAGFKKGEVQDAYGPVPMVLDPSGEVLSWDEDAEEMRRECEEAVS